MAKLSSISKATALLTANTTKAMTPIVATRPTHQLRSTSNTPTQTNSTVNNSTVSSSSMAMVTSNTSNTSKASTASPAPLAVLAALQMVSAG
jgi:transcription initiation factor TFIID subunit TAF12